ncbi:unnamed protein product [Paramecium sonneborni]|uniref:Uncharacterized protein n=1 Tax=Paramecium sonneborni TaxID=65129 RepID=A0A8S1RU94_9CILI|nr:unnamed protein product [Paramecium sonneborni]
MTNIFKQDTKQSLCDNHNSNILSSQYTIFNQTIHSTNFNNNNYNHIQKGLIKKLNSKTILTQYKISHQKTQYKAQQHRTINLKKQSLQRNNSTYKKSLNLEDSDNSKIRNIEQFLEFHNDITYATQIQRNQRQIEINHNNLNSQFYQFDNQGSPAMHNNQGKPLQFPESIDEMMRILFPKPSTILVVDDSPVNVFAFRLIMQKYDFIHGFDYPYHDGYELTEQIRIMGSYLFYFYVILGKGQIYRKIFHNCFNWI